MQQTKHFKFSISISYKNFDQTGIKWDFVKLIKGTNGKPTTKLIYHSKKSNTFPLKLGTGQVGSSF